MATRHSFQFIFILMLHRLCRLGILAAVWGGTMCAQQVGIGGEETNANSGAVLVPADTHLIGAPYLDAHAPIEERVEDLLQRLTPEEKAALLHGVSELGYGNIPRIGLPEVLMTDGPQGLRLKTGVATAFPCGLAMAATWDRVQAERVGAAMGEECRALNRHVLLAPGLNIMRTPLGGRNFEYRGEDPYLAGESAAAFIRGVQSEGVAACAKHWNLNEQEHWRTTTDVNCDERALHEIYAAPFEIAVREGGVWAVMPAYNRFRGDYCTASAYLNKDILEHEYGFDGALISDWGAWHEDQKAITGGCTIQMPSGKDEERDARIAGGVARGEYPQSAIDEAVRRDLRLLFRVHAFETYAGGSINTREHQQIARQAAAAAVVLLKNEGRLLPLEPGKLKKIAVIGPNANQYQTMADGASLAERGGSGAVRCPFEVTPLAALKARWADKVVYAPGYAFDQTNNFEASMAAAVAVAKNADVVLFFGGTDHTYDREALGWGDVPGADKPDLNFKGPQMELIHRIAAVNPHIVLVILSGAPVLVESCYAETPAMLELWYGGMEAGEAIADVLDGTVNPSGKLPCTFGRKLDDWLCHQLGLESFPGTGNDGVVRYLDGIWVGYRHFDEARIKPRFPFGYGLSYTTFRYGPAQGWQRTMDRQHALNISIPITNTGRQAGAEVVELYVHEEHAQVSRPPQELKGFAKLWLAPGESKMTSFQLSLRDLSYWDVANHDWKADPGRYEVRIGASSRDIRSVWKFELRPETTATLP